MPYVTVQRFRQLHKGQPVDLYMAAVAAEEVIARSDIDILTTENPEGYQRRLEPPRVRSIARYVAKGEGLLPTSLGVNIRTGAYFEQFPDIDDGSFGRLHFEEDVPWYIWEGQHRTGGIAEAIEQQHARRHLKGASAEAAAQALEDAVLGYELPVTFSIGLSQDQEMDIFEVVNSKQRPVPTDLVASITFTRVTEERGKDEPGHVSLPALRKAAGVGVGRYLSDRAPWKGHIQGVNEPKDVVAKPMQANTFASTLLPLMRERWVHTRFLTNPDDPSWLELSKVVARYWEVLAELMPEAFIDIEHYSVQRPAGVYAFHELLPEVMDALRMGGDWSTQSYRELLERLGPWVQSSTWHRETGEDIIKGSGNRAAIKVVVERMRTYFHQDLEGLDE
jgi:DGQHR domain-containing protein